MKIISSCAANPPPEIAQNQSRARESWANEIGQGVLFIDDDDGPPTIRKLAEVCANQPGWSAICNCDIVIGPNWRLVERELLRSRVSCAISKRWELPADRNLDRAQVVDLGLDFFAATPAIWAAAAREVPEVFRLGKIMWDTWMLGFFMHASQGNCADITPAKVVFHPKHGGRGGQHIEPPPMKYRPLWPAFKIGEGWHPRMGERKPVPMAAGGGGGAEMPI